MRSGALRLVPFLLLLLLASGTWSLLNLLRGGGDSVDGRRIGVVALLDDGRTMLVDEREGVLGTTVTLTLIGDDDDVLRDASSAAFDRIEEMEARLSRWRPTSDVSRVNARPGRAVLVHPETAGVLERALAVARITGGAFDPTASPILALWRNRTTLPTEEEVSAARALVGADRVSIRGTVAEPTVRLEEGMRLDLGGIAKGTIVDAAGDVLRERGIETFLVNAGGDMLARGAGPDGDGILVDLRHPRGGPTDVLPQGRLRLRDQAVCTSGSYERFVEIAGRRYSHIVDPRTGRPVADAVLQATVVAETCETADAFATALMVLDREEGLALAGRRAVEALLVLPADGSGPVVVASTPGFERLLAEADR
jgi:thiamine biosynthesis lipoprotein